MRLADEMLAVPGEEPAVAIVQTDGNVAAHVLVGHQLAREAGEEALGHSASSLEFEFERLAFGKLVGIGDTQSIHRCKIGANP